MRKIKFRGKAIDNGEWVFGNLLLSEKPSNREFNAIIVRPFANETDVTRVQVEPKTVGQFTGLEDKKGNEIYEGDHFGNALVPVNFKNGIFQIGGLPLIGYLNGDYIEQVEEIKGNMHDKSEPLNK